MDHTHFGLTRQPFPPGPDTDLYFPAASHEAAHTALRAAFASRHGTVLLDGEAGTGKTLAALRFLGSLPPAVPRVLIPAPRFARPADFFQAVLFDLGAPYHGLSEQELRLAVTDHLLKGLASGSPTVVVIDEAQHLPADVLEEIRLLGNLESRTAKAAFVLLVALPPLRDRLGRKDLAAFAQRVAVRPRVEPLTPDESAAYLTHQLEACGGDAGELLSEEAAAVLAGATQGVPRLLNQAAAAAFALAAAAGEESVDVEAAVEALAQLGLAEPEALAEPEPLAVLPHPAAPADDKPAAVKPRPAKRRSA